MTERNEAVQSNTPLIALATGVSAFSARDVQKLDFYIFTEKYLVFFCTDF